MAKNQSEDLYNLDRPRRLMRSQTDKIIFGVCGGIAEYYNIESIWVRLVFIFLGVTGAIGFILYISLAILMPNADNPKTETRSEEIKNFVHSVRDGIDNLSTNLVDRQKLERRRNILGLGIVVIGIIAFFNEIFPNFWIGWKILWPIIIILIGLSFISDSRPTK